MIPRPFWVDRIERAWEKRSIVWLSGVRRVGKTTLSRMLSCTDYLNCDLPSVGRRLQEPEFFFDGFDDGDIVILDEIHQLEDPSRVLKIAADAYPHLKVLATGSSTLAATRRFRDSLTGRKTPIHLPPILWTECKTEFGIRDLDRRLLHGGLPEPLMAQENDAEFFSEWINSFYARDMQDLFGIRNRTGFLKLLQLLLRQSGGLLEYSNLAKLSDLSRQTVKAHVEAMCISHAVILLPPYHGGGRREITRTPKAFAFDTGFISFVNGWDSIREGDRGLLWEHLVLDLLREGAGHSRLFHWRDKSGREVDFVLKRQGRDVDAFECKIDPDRFDPRSLKVFRRYYPHGRNTVVNPVVKTPYLQRHDNLEVRYCGADSLWHGEEMG